jgi:sodium-dependent phosphate cotransporter
MTLIAGLFLLFLSLRFLVDLLRSLFSDQAEEMLHKTLFRSALPAAAAGVLLTVMVQSSSITTSVVVPLIGAGVVTLEQIFPFMIGANIGTTVTAMLAALSTGNPAAISVAISHLMFNLCGGLLIYPLRPIRAIPLAMARWIGRIGARNRFAAAAYIAGMFFGLPLLFLFISGALR